MAEITRQDLITDDALIAPAILSKNLMEAVGSLDKFLATSKKIKDTTDSGKASIGKMAKATDEAAVANRELAKVQAQISTTLEKNNREYINAQKRLQEVKKELKDKIDLSNRDRLVTTAQNSSITQLGEALKANRVAYANLTSEQARNSKEGKQLLAVIQSQDEGYKSLKSSIGQNQDKVGDYEGAMKGLKLELKEAKNELIGIGAKFGEQSKEFAAAAQKVGQLKDSIDDANQAAKSLSGTPVENFTGSFGLLVDKLKGGDLKGAAGAINGIAASAKALTFAEAASGLGSFIKSLGGLATALLTNPIFLLAAAITGIVVAFGKFKDAAEKLSLSTLSRLEREKKAVEERYNTEIRLAQVAGKATEDLEIEKEKQLIKKNEEKLNVLKRATGLELALATNLFYSVKKYDEERLKQKSDIYNEIIKSENNIKVLSAERAEKEFQEVKKLAEAILEKYKKEREAALLLAEQKRQALNDQLDAEALAEINRKEKDEQELVNLLDNIDKRRFANTQFENSKRDEVEKSSEEYIEWEKKRGTAALRFEDDRKLAEEARKKRVQQELADLQMLGDIYSSVFASITQILGNSNAAAIQGIDSQILKIRERSQIDLELAGSDAAAKEAITRGTNIRLNALEKEKRKQQREAAEREKIAAIIDAGIKTALAVLVQLSGGDPYTAFGRSVAAGAIGALQIAAIASKPIPQFADGVENFKGGMAIVGERGSELLERNGKVMLSDSKPTLMNLGAGTTVVPHEETMKRLAGLAVRGVTANGGRQENYNSELKKVIEQGNKNVVNAIKSSTGNAFMQGTTAYAYQKDLDGNKKMIRLKSFSE